MCSRLDFAALEDCLKTLNHLFIDIDRLKGKAGYEEKRGGYGDVQVSRLDSGTAGSPLVAAKTIRLKARHKEPQRLAFRLARELKVWSGLRHPHVLPLLGYYLDKDYKIAVLISEYMIHGDLKDYIEQEKPSWDRRLPLIRDLTDGLAYLHRQDPPILHGDLKTGNILINRERRAILADFGLSKALEEGPTGLTTSEGLKGTLRYYSPELISEQDVHQSLPSDIWAWACLVLEVLTDRIPYAEKKSEHSIILALMKNEPPGDAKSLPVPVPTIKDLLANCWTIQPDDRPSAEHCLRILTAELVSLQMNTSSDNSHRHDTLQSFESDGANSPDQPLRQQTAPQASPQPPPRSSNAPMQFVQFFSVNYNAWIARRGLHPHPPTIDGTQVALHKLFLTVGALGGFRIVNEKKLWPFIGKKIGFPHFGGPTRSDSKPEVAEQLSQIYQDFLADFEVQWRNAFKTYDPKTIFPLPPQLQYLHPEIENLVKNVLPILSQLPSFPGAARLRPQIESGRGSNSKQMSRQTPQIDSPQATPQQNEPISHTQKEVTSVQKGSQDARPANPPPPQDQSRYRPVHMQPLNKREVLAQRARQLEAADAAILDPSQEPQQLAPADQPLSGLERAPPPKIRAAGGSPVPSIVLPPPSNHPELAATVPLLPGLEVFPEQVVEAQEKIRFAFGLFHKQDAFPPVVLSNEQGIMLKQILQQVQGMMKEVTQNLISFVVLAPDDEGYLSQVASAMVVLIEQTHILRRQPPDQCFILELDDLYQYRSYLATFLAHVKGLQSQAIALQNKQTCRTPRSNPLLTCSKGTGVSPTFQSSMLTPESSRKGENTQASAGSAIECSTAPSSPWQATAGKSMPARPHLMVPSSAVIFPSTSAPGGSQSQNGTGTRKRSLEAISTGPEYYSNPYNTCKRARPDPQETIGTELAEKLEGSPALEPDLGAAEFRPLK